MTPLLGPVVLLIVTLQAPILLDRTVAIVGGRPLLQSDVLTAQRLGLLEGDGVTAASVGRLVDRELQLREAERFFPFRAEAAAIHERIGVIERRMGGREAMLQTLSAGGLSPERLRSWLRDDLHIEAYVRQRFAAEERREELLADWIADLRRRTTVVLLAP
jgi:hypothetical protein